MRKIWLLVSLFVILCVGTVKAAYIDEYPEAYKWAYKNWITTMNTMDKANMYGEITRIELSKMISNYAINVLNKKPDTTKKCEFTDISDKLNKQYDSWVTKACQLWLMWQWITKFRPYDNVTRAEFGTILSRLLFNVSLSYLLFLMLKSFLLNLPLLIFFSRDSTFFIKSSFKSPLYIP